MTKTFVWFNKKREMKLSCGKCKCVNNISKEMSNIYYTGFYRDTDSVDKYTVECCSCGAKYNIYKDTEELSYATFIAFFRNAFAFKNKDHKFGLKIFFDIYGCFGDKIQYQTVELYHSFNVKTGQSYILPIKVNGKPKSNIINNTINAISHPSWKTKMTISGYMSEINKKDRESKFYEEIKKLLFMMANEMDALNIPHIDPNELLNIRYNDYFLGNLNDLIMTLVYFNRFPLYKTKTARKLVSDTRKGYRGLLDLTKRNCDVYTVIKKYNVPKQKSIRRSVAKHPISALAYNYLSQVFKDINNLNKALSNYDLVSEFDYYKELISKRSSMYYSVKSQHCESNNNATIEKLNTLKEMLKGESNLIKKLDQERTDIALLHDTAMMYKQILNNKPDYKVSTKGSLRDIHNRLARDLDKLKRKNYAIHYYDFERLLEREESGYRFVLAKDTHELVDIGEYMSICVGSYEDIVINKKCTIISVIKNNKYICCMEITPNYSAYSDDDFLSSGYKITNDTKKLAIIQAKIFGNELPQGDLKSAILKWARDCKLAVKTSDLY